MSDHAFSIPTKSIRLKVERPYHTERKCRVDSTWFCDDRGVLINEVTLSCAPIRAEEYRRAQS